MGKTRARARKKAAAAANAAPIQKKSLKQAVKKAGEKITAAFKAKEWQGALAALHDMRAAGLPPTPVLCNKVITALCRHGELEQAWELVQQMLGRGDPEGVCAGVAATPVTFATIIKFCGQQGHLERVFAVVDAMTAAAAAADTVCWNTAVSACASEAAAAWPRALELLQRAIKARCADVVTYNAALGVLQKAAQAAEARKLLAHLAAPQGSIQPNDVSYTATIAACAAARDSVAAFEVLEEMRRSSVAVTTPACNAAMSACERAGRWQDALALLQRMEDEGPPPDAVTVRCAVFACCSASPGPPRVAEAKNIFKRVEAGEFAGVPHNAVTYNVLVRACDVDVVRNAAAQVALLAGFLNPGDSSDASDLTTTVAGAGGLETMQESMSQPVLHESTFEVDPFDWPAALRTAEPQRVAQQTLASQICIVAHEKGFQRRPRNKYDLNVWSIPAQAFPSIVERPPVVRHDVPQVNGAFLLCGVFTPRECEFIIAAAETMGFAPDEPLTRGAGAIGGGEARIDGCVWLAEDGIMGPIFNRCKPYLPPSVAGGAPAGINARWRLFRYDENAVYRPHVDGSWPGSGLKEGKLQYDAYGDRWSRMTFLVYLNDDFEGGATTFFTSSGRDGLQARRVKPQQGAVLLFPHGIDNPDSPVHEGSKVSAGQKYVVRTDLLFFKPDASE